MKALNPHLWLYLSPLLLATGASHANIAANGNSEEELDALFREAFGKENEQLPGELEADLRVNGNDQGTILARTNGKTITQLQREALLPKLRPYLKESLLKSLEKNAANSGWLSASALEAAGIRTRYDIQELAVAVKIDKKSMNRRMRSLLSALPGDKQHVIPERLADPAKVSGYINLSSGISQDFSNTSAEPNLNVRAESAVNVHGFVLENQHTYQHGTNGKPGKLTRDYTRLVIDDAEEEHRYRIGDISTESRNFQGSLPLGGVQVTRDLTWASSREYTPQGNQRFSLSSPAEVDIYLDGRLHRSVRLQAGEHELAELDALGGTSVKLRIKDDLGKITTQEFSRFTDSRLLSPEFSRYSISVGFPSRREADQLKYDTKRPVASGYYQQGVTENLTAGVDVQTDGKAHQVGGDIIWATEIGNVTAGVSHSQSRNGKKGQAARVQISRRPDNRGEGDKQRPIQWDIAAERFTPDYQNLNPQDDGTTTTTSTQAVKQQLNASVSKAFSDRTSGNLGVAHTTQHDGKTRTNLNAGVSTRLGKNLNVSVYGSQSRDAKGAADMSVRVGFSMPLDATASGRGQSVSGSHDDKGRSQLAYRISGKGKRGVDSLSGGVRLQSERGKTGLGADVRYQGEAFDANLSITPQLASSKVGYSGSANVNTAIVFADGAVAMSRPVHDSFAILEPPEGLEHPMAASRGKNLFQRKENTLDSLPERYDAVMQPGSKAVLNNLASYQVQHVSSDSAVLPEGFDLDATEFDVMPDYKSGYRVKVGGERGAMLEAHLADASGQPLKLQGGQLIALDAKQGGKPIQFFTDDAGVMRLSHIRQGNYRVELFSLPDLRNPPIRVTGKPGETQTLDLRATS
ncbi:hypothetical protein [Thiothrix sp.]|jgi:outer membrane usher protein|uniref:hypothetical protein n=1 Tax=Thiothrix sp. TaxID=1032 RepID=UPI0025810AB1|nr:hypothetical protein [Thiothrix sp.]